MSSATGPTDITADDKATIAADDQAKQAETPATNGATVAPVANGAAAAAPAVSSAPAHAKTHARKSTASTKDKAAEEPEFAEGEVLKPSGEWPPPIYLNLHADAQERFYLEHRWYAQWEWYDKRATFFKKRYQRIQLGIGIGSGVVPALVAITPNDPEVAAILRLVTIGISLLVTALTVWENVYKHGDNWRTFRAAAEDLAREKTLYDMQAGHYKKVKRPFQRFVERCEEVIAKQNGQWLQQQEQQLVADDQSQKQQQTTGTADKEKDEPVQASP